MKSERKSMRFNRRGSVSLVMVLLIVVALSVLASGVILLTTTEIFVSRNAASAKEAFYAAEAGLHRAERVLTNVTIDDIRKMYANGYDGCLKFGGVELGHKFCENASNTGTWVRDAAFDGVRAYEVYVENDEWDTATNKPSLVENNGSFLIRVVGKSGMGARKILEVMYAGNSLTGIEYNSQLGGGPGNMPPQLIR